MDRLNGLTRRGLLKAGGALGMAVGASSILGNSAFAQEGGFIPYSNKSLDYYFFVI